MERPGGDQVEELVARIREEAARTEAERAIATEVLTALMETGVFAVGPERSDVADLLDMVHLVAGACGSTGWLTAHAGAAPLLLDAFPSGAVDVVRATTGADPLVAFSLEPGGRMEQREGSAVLSGRWSAVTGAAHAGWLLLGARRATHEGPGPIGLALVPTDACRLTPAVDTIGLTAVGALEVSAEEVEVAETAWCAIDDVPRATAVMVGAAVAMALVGAAQGALDEHLDQVRRRVERSHGGEDIRVGDLAPTMTARAASILDAAALILRSPAAPDVDPDALPQDRFEHQIYAANRAVQAAELVFSSARTHALTDDDPVARLWRDVRVGGHQAHALTDRLRTMGL